MTFVWLCVLCVLCVLCELSMPALPWLGGHGEQKHKAKDKACTTADTLAAVCQRLAQGGAVMRLCCSHACGSLASGTPTQQYDVVELAATPAGAK